MLLVTNKYSNFSVNAFSIIERIDVIRPDSDSIHSIKHIKCLHGFIDIRK